MPPRRQEAGLTLIELIIGLAIAATLALAAAPAFTEYMANSRLRAGGNLQEITQQALVLRSFESLRLLGRRGYAR